MGIELSCVSSCAFILFSRDRSLIVLYHVERLKIDAKFNKHNMKAKGFNYQIQLLFPLPLRVYVVLVLLVMLVVLASSATVAAKGSPEPSFADNKTCTKCHAKQAQDWLGSDHEKAMQEANGQTVLGNFNNISFVDAGVTSRFFKKQNRYFINTLGPAGEYADFEVKYTFGVKPLQQYLLLLPKGKLQAFTVAWDTEKKQWIDLYPGEKFKPDSPLHWSGRAFTANSSCMECHTTNMALNFDVSTAEYHTTFSEVNVSCQSCHGPGSNHVDWAQSGKQNKKNEVNKGLIVDYKTMEPYKQVESCSRCHSRRYSVSENNKHGRSFFDDYMPELLREETYHADGQILDEVYVYGSFVQSKMYSKGVACMDCHDPHTLKLHEQGNGLCVRCHQATSAKAQFPSLNAKSYDTPTHHFHKAGTAGAQCVNCHMPETTYMQVDPRRDHSFSIPRPDLSKKWGVPNACTTCHSGKPAEWAITAMNQWYDRAWQARPNIAGTLSQARAGAAKSLKPLTHLIKQPQQPAIVRATALDILPRYGGAAGLGVMLDSLADTSPLVRTTALRGLDNLPAKQKFKEITALLSDPVQGVRIEAARLLAAIPKQSLTETEQQQLKRGLNEYKAAQMALSDHPEGHINLGNLYARMGQIESATLAYRTAINMDAYFSPAYSSLANLYYASGQKKEAEDTFRKGLEHVPNAGKLHYSLALLLAEQKKTKAAVEHLAMAASLMPEQVQIHYNYGLLLQKLKRIPEAEKALLHAYKLVPNAKKTLRALVILYKQKGQLEKSEAFMRKLGSKSK